MRRGVLLSCLLLSAACSPNRGDEYRLAMAKASRAYGAGRSSEAAEAYELAARQAKVARDGRFARYQAGLTWLKAGQVARGLALLDSLAGDDDEYAASAAYKSADYKFSRGDAGAEGQLQAVMLRHPDSGWARNAFRKLLRAHETRGDAKQWLHSTRAKAGGSDLEQLFAYEHARRLDQAGETDAALREYLAVAARWPYPKGVHHDDALFRAAELEERLDRPTRAIEHLRSLLANRESAHIMGTYERPRYPEAALRIAEIHEKQGDRARARKAYRDFYASFRTSVQRDDALWREAALHDADGDHESACATRKLLTREFPDSRYVPCASERCSDLQRPKNSRAPVTCRAYLKR